MSDGPKCSLCGRSIDRNGTEVWSSEDGTRYELPVNDLAYAVLDLNGDEFIVCEQCYGSERIRDLAWKQQQELHFQFGLEYRDLERPMDALVALVKALSFSVEARVLNELATVCALLNRVEDGEFFLNQCLILYPGDPIATANKGVRVRGKESKHSE